MVQGETGHSIGTNTDCRPRFAGIYLRISWQLPNAWHHAAVDSEIGLSFDSRLTETLSQKFHGIWSDQGRLGIPERPGWFLWDPCLLLSKDRLQYSLPDDEA